MVSGEREPAIRGEKRRGGDDDGPLKGPEARSHPTFCSRRGDSLIPGLGVSKPYQERDSRYGGPFDVSRPLMISRGRMDGHVEPRPHRIWVEAAPRGDNPP